MSAFATDSKNPGVVLDSLYDLHSFDLERYRNRMAKYLAADDIGNEVFFDALQFAHELHEGQRRKSGAPYISHPCAVAEILAREMHLSDPVLLAAALLHDVVEDVPSIRLEDIEDRFGSTVAELVDGCTKLTRRHIDKATLRDLTHSKIFLSASRRLGVLIIKLGDRLHNLRTLHYLPQAKRMRIAQETVEVYAPIAARFNIFPIKRELYHLALSYLYPRKSKKILSFIREMRNSPAVLEIENRLEQVFSNALYPVTIRPRAKGLGNYYDHRKKILDISNGENHVDFAIILQDENILNCYLALGLVNTTFTPIPRSLKDFIAISKNNGYRSLHVRIHEKGNNYLIKIRTPEMDRWSTYGIVYEWNAQKTVSDEHWQEVSELLRSIGEYGGAGAQRKALIRLSETEETFVYSPTGDIYYLPKGSIVLDFAYRIHSELGDYCEGALVNNEWSSPTRLLKDGDVVEIFTSSEPLSVEPDLEDLCKTPKARTAINKHLQQRRRYYAEDVGRQIIKQELRKYGFSEDIIGEDITQLLPELLNLKDFSEVFARIGQDLLTPKLVMYYLGVPSADRVPEPSFSGDVRTSYDRNIILISELDKAVHKFAKCCHPYPGQANVVATLSERGATFHHKDCGDLSERHGLQPQQLVEVVWDRGVNWRHSLLFTLHILHETPASLIPFLAHLPSIIHIQSLDSALDKHYQPMVRMTVRFNNFEEAQSLFECLSADRMTIEDYKREESSRARLEARSVKSVE